MANQHLQNLLEKEVSRKEFMALSALVIGTIFGFGTVIKLLTGKSLNTHTVLQNTGSNSTDYGGKLKTIKKVA